MFRGDYLPGNVRSIEDTGCCEDLKAAFAYMDKFVLKKYFETPEGEEKLQETAKEREMHITIRDPIPESKLEED